MSEDAINAWVNNPSQNVAAHTKREVIQYLQANRAANSSEVSVGTLSKWSNTYFTYGIWISRNNVNSLSLMPKNWWLGNPHYKPVYGPKAWDTVYARFHNDQKWKQYSWATDSMYRQFKCHVGYGTLKTPYNLEPSEKSTNPITCN